MAIKAVIYKADLQISDMDRHYYANHALTVALHPSETKERMMVRLLVFALHAHEYLVFTRGLSSDDEPDVWQKSLSGEIESWIDLGQPDEKRIRKACGRANQVYIYTYAHRSATIWWQQMAGKLARYENLHVVSLPEGTTTDLAQLVTRNMSLQCTVQDGEMWFGDAENSVHVVPEVWK